MRRILQSLIFLISLAGFSQSVYIPDVNFKQSLTASTTTLSVATAANGSFIKVDANDDGAIDASEVVGIYSLFVGNRGIADLTGISAFSSLQDLRCNDNMLQTLDVSGLAHLRVLDCSTNNLTNVTLDGTAIQQFNCMGNNLTSIPYNELDNVIQLNISNNNLGPSLTLPGVVLPAVNLLNCSGNALTSLTITNAALQLLYCIDNQLTSLDTSGMPDLSLLQCGLNQITSLDFSSNTIQYLMCDNNQLTTLALNTQHYLDTVFCQQNPLQSIYIKNGRNETLFIGSGMTTLQYICADETQLSSIQSTLNTYGYSSCQLDSSCSLSTGAVAVDDTLIIYPNPAADFFNIAGENLIIETVEVYNLLGQLLFTKVCPCEIVEVNFLHPGVYNVIIKTTSGISTRKFLKS